MKNKKCLCGTPGLFSGMNSACPNCKGRRAVKKSSWDESVSAIVIGTVVKKPRYVKIENNS